MPDIYTEKNISPVLHTDVCTGCGICSCVCPPSCLSTSFDPKKGYYITSIDEQKCIACGRCRNVCPVLTWNNTDADHIVGKCIKAYSAYSTDTAHRKASASGGMVTTLLSYMLDKGIVDACVLAVRDTEDPLKSRLIIAETPEQVMRSRGSVYAPTTYADIVGEMCRSQHKRFAVVALPCHIQGLTQMASLNKNLRDKLFVKIALVCGGTPSERAYAYTMRHLKIDAKALKSVSNRGDGWPGYLKFSLNDGNEVRVPYKSYYSWGTVFSSPIFTPPGCRSCADMSGYEADISIGDAWLDRFKGDVCGRNLLLIRNEQMLDILTAMADDGKIDIHQESIDDFIKANANVAVQKLFINRGRKRRRLSKHHLYPEIEACPVGQNLIGYLAQRCLYISERLMAYIPVNRAILLYFKILRSLSTRWTTIRKY